MSEEENDDIPTNLHEDVHMVIQRPQGIRILPSRLEYCEVIIDNEVINDKDLVHFALLANAEPINHNEALNREAWNNAMVE